MTTVTLPKEEYDALERDRLRLNKIESGCHYVRITYREGGAYEGYYIQEGPSVHDGIEFFIQGDGDMYAIIQQIESIKAAIEKLSHAANIEKKAKIFVSNQLENIPLKVRRRYRC